MDICRPKQEKATVWEIKHSGSLSPKHLLQVAIYMLLLGEPASGFLMSARTGQTVQVLPKTSESLTEISQLLIDAKSGGTQTRLLNTYSDDEFLAECRSDFAGLVGKCALPAWFSMKPTGTRLRKGFTSGKRIWKTRLMKGIYQIQHRRWEWQTEDVKWILAVDSVNEFYILDTKQTGIDK